MFAALPLVYKGCTVYLKFHGVLFVFIIGEKSIWCIYYNTESVLYAFVVKVRLVKFLSYNSGELSGLFQLAASPLTGTDRVPHVLNKSHTQ